MSTFLEELSGLVQSVENYEEPDKDVGSESSDEVVLGTVEGDHYSKALYTLARKFGRERKAATLAAMTASIVHEGHGGDSDLAVIKQTLGVADCREDVCINLLWENIRQKFLSDVRASKTSGIGIRRGWKVVVFNSDEEDRGHQGMVGLMNSLLARLRLLNGRS